MYDRPRRGPAHIEALSFWLKQTHSFKVSFPPHHFFVTAIVKMKLSVKCYSLQKMVVKFTASYLVLLSNISSITVNITTTEFMQITTFHTIPIVYNALHIILLHIAKH